MILALFLLFTVFNYSLRGLALHTGDLPVSVMTVPMLLLGVFMSITYLIYPAEVISPGWTTFKRMMVGYSPVLFLYLFYQLTMWLGVDYTPYSSLLEMMPDIGNFDVLFRLFLCLVIFLLPFLLYCVPFTRKYSNTDREWVRNYIIIAAIKSTSYIAVLLFENMPVHILYYYITSITTFYLTYVEVFIRIIPAPTNRYYKRITPERVISPSTDTTSEPEDSLFEKMERYLSESEIWRDPELTFERLAKEIKTNRTTLWKAFSDAGQQYNHYIARIRIEAYIDIVRRNPNCSYMNAFYEVGYRSKTTALRNFRMITDTTPAEYFQQESPSQI